MTEMTSGIGNSAASRDKAYYLHPYTNLKTHEDVGPLVIERGEGVHVFDDSGKDYIEGMAGLWCTSLGFGEERLVEAATRQMRKLPFYHAFTHKAHDPGIDLAEALIKIAPVPMSKVFFANSGSEANDTVVKLVWYYNNALGRPQKKKIIARQKGYHGVTVASASLTGLPQRTATSTCRSPASSTPTARTTTATARKARARKTSRPGWPTSWKSSILAEGPDTIAAFIAEPVMGAGGVIVPPATYFDKIQAVLKRYDILFIADEVICGFGRTGSMFGTQTYDLQPDIITVAKALSSAYLPISAVMISEPIYQAMVRQSDKIGTFGHGYTYSGHPVSAAVALETLKIYEERDIVSHVRTVAPHLQDGLRRFGDHPLVGEVRGIGLIAGVEIVADKATKAPFDPKLGIGGHVARFAQEHGLIVRAMGDSIGFSPPLIITSAELDDLTARFGKALDDTVSFVTDKGLAAVA